MLRKDKKFCSHLCGDPRKMTYLKFRESCQSDCVVFCIHCDKSVEPCPFKPIVNSDFKVWKEVCRRDCKNFGQENTGFHDNYLWKMLTLRFSAEHPGPAHVIGSLDTLADIVPGTFCFD